MTSVLVIGAGIAGLTAAYRLAERGFTVRVVEAADEPGGRMGDRRAGEIAFNSGARLIYPFGRALHALIRDVGLADAMIPLRDLAATCRVDGREYRLALMPGLSALRTPGLNVTDRARLIGFAGRLAALRSRVNPDDLASAGGDDETLAAYADRTIGANARARLFDALFRGTRSWDLADISSAFLLTTLPHMLGRRAVFTLAGGMGRLTRTLAERLHTRLGATVASVSRNAAGCRTRFADGTVEPSDLVVIAAEGARAAALLAEKEPEEARFFATVRYNSLGIVHYALRENIPPTMRFIDRTEFSSIATFQQLPAGSGRPHAQLFCQLTPEATRTAVAEGRVGALEALIHDDCRRLFPDLDRLAIAHEEQWIEHKLPIPYPGYAATMKRFRSWQTSGPRRVVFAGDYLAQALVSGACASGETAARTIAQHWPAA